MESARKELSLKSILFRAASIAVLTFGVANALQGQGRPEMRADAVIAHETAIYAGAGILFPMGTYLRSGLIAGAGTVNGAGTFRVDLVSVFHSDPFRESRWGPYGGGGLSLRHDNEGARSNAFLLVFLGVEGPPSRGFAPAVELGLGGGVRAGLILRRSGGRTR